jgi:hypothetical protein
VKIGAEGKAGKGGGAGGMIRSGWRTGSGPLPAFSPRFGIAGIDPGGWNGPMSLVVGGGEGFCVGGLAESKGPSTRGPSLGSGSRKSGVSREGWESGGSAAGSLASVEAGFAGSWAREVAGA